LDRCYYFKNIFAEKFVDKIGVFAQNKAKLCKNWIITLVFEIFSPKIGKKIAENCDHNIDQSGHPVSDPLSPECLILQEMFA
jgi:hypothetical protein